MKNPIGFGLAIAATASLAFAGGEGEDKKKAKKADSGKRLETLGNASSPQGGGATVSAAAGDGFTISAGDEFSLKIKNRVQVLWRYSSFDNASATPNTNNFSIRRARTKLSGHVWDKTQTYNVQMDWTRSGSPLLDAWFRWAFWSNEDSSIALRLGQQKPHHGREFSGTSGNLEHTQRSLASRTFSGNRVIGAYLQGTHLEGDKLHWNAGVANGDAAAGSAAFGILETGTGAANVDNELNFFFDVRVDPFGDFGDEGYAQGDLGMSEEAAGTIGASLMVGNHRTGVVGAPDVESTSINIYTAWKYQGFHALAEVFIRSDDQDTVTPEGDSTGWSVGGSYTLQPQEEGGSQWGFGVRYSMIDIEIPGTGPFGETSEIEGTISNYYHAHKMKTQIAYRHQTVDPAGVGSDIDNDFIDVMFQWMF